MENKGLRLTDVSISPEFLKVRTLSNLSLSFSLDQNLPNNSVLTIRLRGGRNNKNDWYFLQTYDDKCKGYTKLRIEPPANFIPILTTGKELGISYLIINKKGIPKGSQFKIEINNTLVQSLTENKKPIEILIRHPNTKNILVENSPKINIISNEFDHISLICPSTVCINQNFKILIRVEDQFFNLIDDFNDKVKLVESSRSEKDIGSIDFKEENKGIFWSEHSFINQGLYSIKVVYNNKSYISNPIRCTLESEEKKLYWGYIHGHTNKSDGIRDTEEYFQNMINAGLNFGTTTEHDHTWEISDKDFDDIKNIIKKYQSKEFVSFFGYEYGTWYTGHGDICIYHKNNNIPIMRSDINKYNSTRKLIRNLKNYEGEVLAIAHHTALRPGYRNWESFNNSIERLVEIYSAWGNQEYPHNEGNPLPPRYKFFGFGKYARKRGPIIEKKGSFVQDALKRGYKLGFTAGGDDHFGIYPSGPLDPDNGIYPPGIMAIWAEELTMKSIWNALINRKCYGTTGPRVIINFEINTYFMGDIVNIGENLELKNKRDVNANVISPIKIKRLELIRNNKIIKENNYDKYKIDFKYIDLTSFEEISMSHANKEEKFIFYYLRIFLENQDMAWASPIWFIQDFKM